MVNKDNELFDDELFKNGYMTPFTIQNDLFNFDGMYRSGCDLLEGYTFLNPLENYDKYISAIIINYLLDKEENTFSKLLFGWCDTVGLIGKDYFKRRDNIEQTVENYKKKCNGKTTDDFARFNVYHLFDRAERLLVEIINHSIKSMEDKGIVSRKDTLTDEFMFTDNMFVADVITLKLENNDELFCSKYKFGEDKLIKLKKQINTWFYEELDNHANYCNSFFNKLFTEYKIRRGSL